MTINAGLWVLWATWWCATMLFAYVPWRGKTQATRGKRSAAAVWIHGTEKDPVERKFYGPTMR